MIESTHMGTSTEASAARRRVRLSILVAGGLLVAYHLFVRPWHLDWGATDDEMDRELPGDELVPAPGSETTRAVTVEAHSDEVWPWIVQLGQGRGGFYSYSWLENLVGADIHNVDRIVPELQRLAEGDSIRLVTEDYWLRSPMTSMTVDGVDPGRTLVLRGHDGGTWTFEPAVQAGISLIWIVGTLDPTRFALLEFVLMIVFSYADGRRSGRSSVESFDIWGTNSHTS